MIEIFLGSPSAAAEANSATRSCVSVPLMPSTMSVASIFARSLSLEFAFTLVVTTKLLINGTTPSAMIITASSTSTREKPLLFNSFIRLTPHHGRQVAIVMVFLRSFRSLPNALKPSMASGVDLISESSTIASRLTSPITQPSNSQ